MVTGEFSSASEMHKVYFYMYKIFFFLKYWFLILKLSHMYMSVQSTVYAFFFLYR